MKYAFEKAKLTLSDDVYHRRWLDVVNVGLEIIANDKPANPKIPNPALNGKYVIKGLLDYHGIPNKSPLREGIKGTIKLSQENKFALLPVLFVQCLDIVTVSPHRRCYTWYFGGLSRPMDDQLGLIPSSGNGEMSLDDLLEEIGATRDMLGKVKFDAEGGGDFRDFV